MCKECYTCTWLAYPPQTPHIKKNTNLPSSVSCCCHPFVSKPAKFRPFRMRIYDKNAVLWCRSFWYFRYCWYSTLLHGTVNISFSPPGGSMASILRVLCLSFMFQEGNLHCHMLAVHVYWYGSPANVVLPLCAIADVSFI